MHEPFGTARRLLLSSAFCLVAAGARGQQPAADPPAPAPVAEPPAAAAAPKGRPALRVLRTGGLKVDSAALLLSGQQGGPLPIAVLPLPFPGGGERARVPVVIEVSGRSLLARPAEEADDPLLRVDLAVYALGDQGMIAGTLADTVEIDLERLEDQLGKAGLRYWGELSLLPGNYSLRVLARRHGSATDLGLRSLPLTVPARSTNALLTPFVVPRAGGPWLDVRASSGEPAAALASPLAPISRDGLPEARPVFASPGTVAVEIPAAALPLGTDKLTAALRQAGGQGEAAEVPLTLGDRRATGIAGLELIAARLSIPSLPPGEYLLWVKRGDAVSPPLSVQIAAPEGLPESWAAAGEGGREEAMAEPRAEGRKGRLNRTEVAAFERSFRAALLSLSGGDIGAARAGLSSLESSLLDRKEPIPLGEVAELEIRILRKIGKDDPEALLPILELYGETYRQAIRQRAFQRSTHARGLLLSLADFYGNRSSSTEGKKAMARFLVAFAAELSRIQEPGGASTWAWKRTLDIEPGDEIALLCLAIDAEKRGAYREALPYLEQLHTRHPANREGTLRLAIILARLESNRRARELLAALTEPPAADWTADLAFQELARMQLAAGRPAEAEKTLKAAVARFPADEKLSLLLASALDRQGRQGEARALLASFKPGSPGESAARLRYSDLPEEALRKAHDDFARIAKPQLASLTRALSDGQRGTR